MSWRTTGILFLVLLVVGAAVFLIERRPGGEDEPTATSPSSFVEATDLFDGVTVEEVVRLEIVQTEPADEALFERTEEGSWTQTVPTTTQVISTTLNNNVTGLLNTRATRSFSPEDGDLSPYGLDEPQATIVLAVEKDGSVVRYELALGDAAPTGNATYVLKPGDPRVHLMSTFAFDRLLGLLENVPVPPTPTPAPTPTP